MECDACAINTICDLIDLDIWIASVYSLTKFLSKYLVPSYDSMTEALNCAKIYSESDVMIFIVEPSIDVGFWSTQ